METSVCMCEHGKKCKWIGFHGPIYFGLPQELPCVYIQAHKKYCGGEFIIYDLVKREEKTELTPKD